MGGDDGGSTERRASALNVSSSLRRLLRLSDSVGYQQEVLLPVDTGPLRCHRGCGSRKLVVERISVLSCNIHQDQVRIERDDRFEIRGEATTSVNDIT